MEDEKPFIFPTESRAKHSKLVSYPVGAENLSRALDGVPQHALFTCSFLAGNPHRDKSREQFRVADVSYNRRDRSFYDGQDAASLGIYNPKWSVWVFDVPVDLRAEIKNFLLEHTFPNHVKPWLIANAGVEGKFGALNMSLDYNRLEKQIIVSTRNALAPVKTR